MIGWREDFDRGNKTARIGVGERGAREDGTWCRVIGLC